MWVKYQNFRSEKPRRRDIGSRLFEELWNIGKIVCNKESQGTHARDPDHLAPLFYLPHSISRNSYSSGLKNLAVVKQYYTTMLKLLVRLGWAIVNCWDSTINIIRIANNILYKLF